MIDPRQAYSKIFRFNRVWSLLPNTCPAPAPDHISENGPFDSRAAPETEAKLCSVRLLGAAGLSQTIDA